MDSRRVHRVGTSSLAITLPSKWVHEVGIEPGDSLVVIREGERSLVIFPSPGDRSMGSQTLIEVSPTLTAAALERLLIGAYVDGFESIVVRGHERLTTDLLSSLRKAVSRLTGMAMVESGDDQVVVRVLLDPERCPLRDLLQQMLGLTEVTVGKVPSLIDKRDSQVAREVLALGEHLDQLYYLMVRLLLMAMADRGLATRLGVAFPQQIIGFRLIAKALEEIGDSLETVARMVLVTEGMEWGIQGTVMKPLLGFCERINGHLRKGVSAFLELSRADAEEVLAGIQEMESEKVHFVEQVLLHAPTPRSASVLTVSAMALRDVCRFGRVIGEIALNNSLRSPVPP